MSTSVSVRQGSRVGACTELGSLVYETTAAYVFRRPDGEIAFIPSARRRSTVGPCEARKGFEEWVPQGRTQRQSLPAMRVQPVSGEQDPEWQRIVVSPFTHANSQGHAEGRSSIGCQHGSLRRKTISGPAAYVRFATARTAGAPRHRDDLAAVHSITSSARASTCRGISRPSAFAVSRLITSSYFVGACTGRSAGFSPFRTRSM